MFYRRWIFPHHPRALTVYVVPSASRWQTDAGAVDHNSVFTTNSIAERALPGCNAITRRLKRPISLSNRSGRRQWFVNPIRTADVSLVTDSRGLNAASTIMTLVRLSLVTASKRLEIRSQPARHSMPGLETRELNLIMVECFIACSKSCEIW